MQPPKATERGAITSTNPLDKLPSQDPLKREVSVPYEPTNDVANGAVSFLKGGSVDNPTNVDLKNLSTGNTPVTAEGLVGQASNGVGATDLRKLSDLINPTEDGIRPDYAIVKKRLEDSFGLPGSTGEMSNSLKNSLTDGFNKILGVGDSGILVEGISSILAGDQLTDAKSIVNLINRVSSASDILSVFDLGAQAALVKTITDKLIEWGAPDLIDKLLDAMADVKEKQKMWESVAMRAADASELDIVIKYGEKMGPERRTAIWDTIVLSVVSRYRLRLDVSLKEQDALINRTLELYNPLWYVDQVNPARRSLHYFAKANDDARECLLRGKHRISTQAGRNVRLNNLIGVILSNFPELGMI